MDTLTRMFRRIGKDVELGAIIVVAIFVAILVTSLILFTGFFLHRRLKRRRLQQKLWKQPETRPIHQFIARRRLRPCVRRIEIDTRTGWNSAHARSDGQIDKGHCSLCDKQLVTEHVPDENESHSYLARIFNKLMPRQDFLTTLRHSDGSRRPEKAETTSFPRNSGNLHANTPFSDECELGAMAGLGRVGFASEVSQLLGCGHMFHSTCLVNWWLDKRAYCHVCGFEYWNCCIAAMCPISRAANHEERRLGSDVVRGVETVRMDGTRQG